MKTLVDNIIAVYGQATATERRSGLVWYKRAKRSCNALAKAENISLRHAVGVVAATSPNLKWEKNILTARQVVQAYAQGIAPSDISGCMAYPMNRAKGYAVLRGANRSARIKATLNGPKVTAFYENIMGYDAVTIDGHARNIAYGERLALKDKKLSISKSEYVKLEHAYRKAAATLGLKACDLQAITWTVWRRIHKIV